MGRLSKKQIGESLARLEEDGIIDKIINDEGIEVFKRAAGERSDQLWEDYMAKGKRVNCRKGRVVANIMVEDEDKEEDTRNIDDLVQFIEEDTKEKKGKSMCKHHTWTKAEIFENKKSVAREKEEIQVDTKIHCKGERCIETPEGLKEKKAVICWKCLAGPDLVYRLYLCGWCMKARYCGYKCQEEDWDRHGDWCEMRRDTREERHRAREDKATNHMAKEEEKKIKKSEVMDEVD